MASQGGEGIARRFAFGDAPLANGSQDRARNVCGFGANAVEEIRDPVRVEGASGPSEAVRGDPANDRRRVVESPLERGFSRPLRERVRREPESESSNQG